MSRIKIEKETGAKTRKNRPDAPIYMPPAVRNSHSLVSKSIHKENEENLIKSINNNITKKCHKNSIVKLKSKKLDSSHNATVISNKTVTSETTMTIDHVNVIQDRISDLSLENCEPHLEEIKNMDYKIIEEKINGICRLESNIEQNDTSEDIIIDKEIKKKENETILIDNQHDESNNYKENRQPNLITTCLVNELVQSDINIVKHSAISSPRIEVLKIIDDSMLSLTNNKSTKTEETIPEIINCDISVGSMLLIKNEENILSVDKKWNDKSTDKDVEEFLRASEGLNRCNKRIMKTFNVSDVLIIDDCKDEPEDKVDNWEDLFDDNGILVTSLILDTEVTKNVGLGGNVTISRPKDDYKEYKSRQNEETNFRHIVEIYGFPSEFQTRDLLTILEHYRADTYHIKWVDENHALGIFASENIATDVLKIEHPLIKLRPMSEASKQSILKAKKNPNAMMPVMARPQTCPHAARRMVTGALGLKVRSSKEDREKEKQILKEAREKKRLAVKQQDDAWEGRISSI